MTPETTRIGDVFYDWLGAECLLSARVCGGVDHLWQAYRRYCHAIDAHADRLAFCRALESEFCVAGGLAAGLCLHADAEAFQAAYAPRLQPVAARRVVKVDFLKREAA